MGGLDQESGAKRPPDLAAALRDAARALGTAEDVEETIGVLAEHAVATTRAFGAYVERIEEPEERGGEVEVVAVAGEGCPPIGTRIPYPGSLTEEIIESGESQLMTEVGAIGERMAPYLEESCRGCTGLVLPLTVGNRVLGAMILLRSPEQEHFTQVEADQARALGDMATVAFQRLLLIDKLQESEMRFQQIVDQLEEVVWLAASDLSVGYYVNPVYERIFGRSIEDFLISPRLPVEALHPEDRERVVAALELLSGGGEYGVEYRILRPDGEVRWIWSRGYPVRNERGEVYRVAGVMEDITDRKEAEREREELLRRAREAQAEVSNIVASITDAFITVDKDWTILYANDQARELLDRPQMELSGRNLWEVFPETLGTRFELEYRRAMSEQRTAAVEEYFPPIDRWLDVRAYPTADRLSIYYRDVTERKRVESELRTRVEQLDALSALGQYALAETSLDALFTRAVEVTAWALGVDFVELLELIPGDQELFLRAGTGWRAGLVGHARISASQGSMAGYTLLSDEPLITEDLQAETRFQPSWLLEEHGAVSGLSVIIQGRSRPWGALGAHTSRRHRYTNHDIFFLQSVSNILGQAIELRQSEAERTRLLELEREARRESERSRLEAEHGREELKRITESRSRLMRGFSHDVKNPLGAADGFLQLLEEGVMDELTPKQREGVARARRAIGNAISLIGDLLTIARAESGDVTVDLAPTDLQATITATVEDFQAQATAKGLTLTAELSPDLPTIRSDVDRIRQILGNLLSNAVKYTEEGGITVTAEVREVAEPGAGAGTSGAAKDITDGVHPTNRWVAISVSDTGSGIPPELQSPIFKEFRRAAPREPAGVQKSLGIGLAIAQRIALALGGRITLQSEPGRGSTFTLWLPAESQATD